MPRAQGLRECFHCVVCALLLCSACTIFKSVILKGSPYINWSMFYLWLECGKFCPRCSFVCFWNVSCHHLHHYWGPGKSRRYFVGRSFCWSFGWVFCFTGILARLSEKVWGLCKQVKHSGYPLHCFPQVALYLCWGCWGLGVENCANQLPFPQKDTTAYQAGISRRVNNLPPVCPRFVCLFVCSDFFFCNVSRQVVCLYSYQEQHRALWALS